jgi:nucleotide-binding universal stress UspA family protein
VDTDLEVATAYLERLASDPELAGITVKTSVQSGQVAPTILAEAALYGGDLIVLCHHGSTGALHWIMGSVAEMVARHASIPVLVLREGATSLGSTPADLAQPLHMLVPLDGSAGAQAALEPGAELLTTLAAPGQKTALHLARVIPPVEGKHAGLSEFLHTSDELTRAKHFLRQTTALLREGSLAPTIAQQHIPVTWSVLVDHDVSDALVRLAEQGEETEGVGVFGGCELLAIATHGRAGVQRWVMGSIAERMLAATTRPILIVHPQSQATWKTTREAGEVPVALN